MTNDNPTRFTLSDGTEVTAKKVTNNKYDFQLKQPNGNRKTFVFAVGDENEFSNKKGIKDALIDETLEQFSKIE